MDAERINADFSQRVAIDTDALAWVASPIEGIERRMLDRIGSEVARATSIVRYAPGHWFSAHEHGLGEEFLVLDGVFTDEHGDYPCGTYVRNPPGSRHRPGTGPGCTLFVKLRQMRPTERGRVVIDLASRAWQPGRSAGHRVKPLFEDAQGETVAMEQLAAGAVLPALEDAGGEEILVIQGGLADRAGIYPQGSWLRIPPGERPELWSPGGAVYWAKRGHLREAAGLGATGLTLDDTGTYAGAIA